MECMQNINIVQNLCIICQISTIPPYINKFALHKYLRFAYMPISPKFILCKISYFFVYFFYEKIKYFLLSVLKRRGQGQTMSVSCLSSVRCAFCHSVKWSDGKDIRKRRE